MVGPEGPLVDGIHDYFLADEALSKVAIIGQMQKLLNWREVRIFLKNS